jgi:hypothetical protein
MFAAASSHEIMRDFDKKINQTALVTSIQTVTRQQKAVLPEGYWWQLFRDRYLAHHAQSS